jgi:hypothetical protein
MKVYHGEDVTSGAYTPGEEHDLLEKLAAGRIKILWIHRDYDSPEEEEFDDHLARKDAATILSEEEIVRLSNTDPVEREKIRTGFYERRWEEERQRYHRIVRARVYDDSISNQGESTEKCPATPAVTVEFQQINKRSTATGLIDDMPREVLNGRLGDICAARMLKGNRFPVAYAWPAMLAVAGAMVPVVPPRPNVVTAGDVMTNSFTGLIGDVHTGKSQAIGWARAILDLPAKMFSEVRAGSAEALLKRLARRQKDQLLGRSILIDLDEWAHLFAKAGIDNSTFLTFMTTAFYKRHSDSVLGGGIDVELDCALSFIGGIVRDEFGDCFGEKSMGGLHDRFVFGLCPEGYNFIYRPFEGGSETVQPIAVTIDHDVYEMVAEIRKANPKVGREAENAIRAAHICASFDGRPVLRAIDCEISVKAFITEQLRIREILRPNGGKTNDAIMANALVDWLRVHGGNERIVPEREVLHGLRRTIEKLGTGVLFFATRNLVTQGIIAYGDIPNAQTYRGRKPKGYQLLMESD